MDFLRRLHPSMAARPEAARLARPAAGLWAAQPHVPGNGTNSTDQRPAPEASPLRSDDLRHPETAGSTPAMRGPATDVASPAALNGRPGKTAETERSEPGTTTPSRPREVPARALGAAVADGGLVKADLPPAPPQRPPRATRPDEPPALNARQSESDLVDATPAAAHAPVQPPVPPLVKGLRSTPPPLRAETVRDATRAVGPAAPPVVRVTIDRIDVRLPPAAAPASPAAARTRPASAQPALGDYLRANGSRSPHGGRR